jgi:hypothetical protein
VRTDVLFFPADRDPPLRHEYQFNLDRAAGRESLDRMLGFLREVRETAVAQAAPVNGTG